MQLGRYTLCVVGIHRRPVSRFQGAPAVAECGRCGRTCYFRHQDFLLADKVPVLAATPVLVISEPTKN